MQRLTKHINDFEIYVGPLSEYDNGMVAGEVQFKQSIVKEILAKLAAYEDTGLEPHEVEEIQKQSIDAEPVRHGRWIRRTVRHKNEMHTHYVCSECNDYHGFANDPGESTFNGNYLFCRTCGARMDGGVSDG